MNKAQKYLFDLTVYHCRKPPLLAMLTAIRKLLIKLIRHIHRAITNGEFI